MYHIPKWIAVVLGIITPILFTINGILVKNLTGPRMRFDPSTMAFSSYFVVNCVIIVFAAIYWSKSGTFSLYLFWLGFAGSLINTCGIVCA